MKNEIIKDYLKGNNIADLVRKYNWSETRIRYMFKKENIIFRSRAESLLISRNYKCFENIDSEEKAYWIGFIAADGSIDKNKRKLTITLKGSDENHLEKFKKFLKTDINVKKYFVKCNDKLFECCSINAISNFLCENLKSHNIIQKKSLTYSPALNLIPKNFLKDFWRGLLDGDGSISISSFNNQTISLTGTYETIHSFIDYCSTILKKDLNFRKLNLKNKNNKDINCTQINFGSRQAYILICHFYKDSSIYLDRKYELFKKVKTNYEYYLSVVKPENRKIFYLKINKKIELFDMILNKKTLFNSLKDLKIFLNVKGGGFNNNFKKHEKNKSVYKKRYIFSLQNE